MNPIIFCAFTEWKKTASKNKKRREELNTFCDMEFSMETDKSGMQKDKGFLDTFIFQYVDFIIHYLVLKPWNVNL